MPEQRKPNFIVIQSVRFDIRKNRPMFRQTHGLLDPPKNPCAIEANHESLPFLIATRSVSKCVSQTHESHSLARRACIVARFQRLPSYHRRPFCFVQRRLQAACTGPNAHGAQRVQDE